MAWVTEPGVEVKLSATDASGHRATESYWMDSSETDPTSGGPAALAAAVQGISADAITLIECMIRASQSTPGTGTDGPYCRGADKALAVFQSEDGSEVNFEIGAPNETILDTDKIELDPTDTALSEFIDAMIANAVTAEGKAITGFKRGFRKRNSGVKHL